MAVNDKIENKKYQPQITKSLFKRDTLYDNPKEWKGWCKPGGPSFLWMRMTTKNKAGIPTDKTKLEESLPIIKLDKEMLAQTLEDDNIRIMWIGHATLLVQFDGITILTDPVFGDRCSPIQMVGPKRYRPVPCQIEDLPKIDAVVISHNHYDHLEYEAVLRLNREQKGQIRWFVPEGLGQWFKDVGCGTDNIEEMTWWAEKKLSNKSDSNIQFICVPAQHWSQRTAMDAMKSLWCGWVVKGPNKTFYYTGDTGYCPVFETIGNLYGPMDLSAIPIGCYEPREFMCPQHISPEEAVKIHKEVKSKKSVGIHWGTFDGLGSLEYYLEPRELLKTAVKDNKLKDDDFFTVNHGEIKTITYESDTSSYQTDSKY